MDKRERKYIEEEKERAAETLVKTADRNRLNDKYRRRFSSIVDVCEKENIDFINISK